MKVPYVNETTEVPIREYAAVPWRQRTSAFTIDGDYISYVAIPSVDGYYSASVVKESKGVDVKIHEDTVILVCSRNGQMIVNKSFADKDGQWMAEAKMPAPRSLEWVGGTVMLDDTFIASPENTIVINRALSAFKTTGNRKQPPFEIVDYAPSNEDK